MNSPSCALTAGCPMYSASRFGRMARSCVSSSRSAPALDEPVCHLCPWLRSRALQGGPDQIFSAAAGCRHGIEHALCLRRLVAQRQQRMQCLAAWRGRFSQTALRDRQGLEVIAHLDQQTLGRSCAPRRECASASPGHRQQRQAGRHRRWTPESIASAMRGPTPLTFSKARNSARSSSVAKPNSSEASSRST